MTSIVGPVATSGVRGGQAVCLRGPISYQHALPQRELVVGHPALLRVRYLRVQQHEVRETADSSTEDLRDERRIGDIPARSDWATKAGGFGQIACVYTAQGFEYDWNGVIRGPDLVWRGDRFVSDVGASKDPAFRGKGAAGFDSFVLNIYKVLLTRGMQGTVICSTDPEPQAAPREQCARRRLTGPGRCAGSGPRCRMSWTRRE